VERHLCAVYPGLGVGYGSFLSLIGYILVRSPLEMWTTFVGPRPRRVIST
jgi:hypothetical protein